MSETKPAAAQGAASAAESTPSGGAGYQGFGSLPIRPQVLSAGQLSSFVAGCMREDIRRLAAHDPVLARALLYGTPLGEQLQLTLLPLAEGKP